MPPIQIDSQSPIIDTAKMTSKLRVELAMFAEANVSGFAHIDQEVAFFTQIAAVLRPDFTVLDFGAGRGEWFHDDPVTYRRELQLLKGRCAFVDGCDVDPVVHDNPTLDRATVFDPRAPLPYEDDRFDLIISRYVFEHIEDPVWTSRELLRVTKPGGWICAVTPNKYGYVALASRLVPNRLHAAVLNKVQPHRRDRDVFPTAYRLNTPGDLKRHFGGQADVYYYRGSAVPSYHFGRKAMFRLLTILHWLLPAPLGTGLFVFIRKHPSPR